MTNKFIILLILILNFNSLKSQVFKVDTTYTPNKIVNNYFIGKNHDGIKIKNISYSGAKNSIGLFFYNSNIQQSLPSKGIALSTGNVIDAMAKWANTALASTENYNGGDYDLSKIVNNKTFDSAILEFDFLSLTDSISFIFQFASEEYPQYVRKGVSDIFGFFVSDIETEIKKNIAVLPNTNIPITIDLINNDINSHYYVSNNKLEYKHGSNGSRFERFKENQYLFTFNGYTKPISTGMKLKAYRWYHFKIAIADVGDRKFDSWIFLTGNSFVSSGNTHTPTKRNIKDYLQDFNTDSIQINEVDNKIVILAPIYFDFNSSTIKEAFNNLFINIISILRYSEYYVNINGFADETGEESYNLKLSQERANNVKQYLIDKGINEDRLNAFGKGEITSDINLDKSRKVEFVLYKKSNSQ